MKNLLSLFTLALIVSCSNLKNDQRSPSSVSGKFYFNVPAGAAQEMCEVPDHMPGKEFSEKDLKKLTSLCQMDFYGLTPQMKAYKIKPKLNSTNPGTLVGREKEGDFKVDAKYKQSISCSYYPSIIAYYYLSEFFGTVSVPRAVYRTMDKDEHKKITKLGLKYSKSGSMIQTLWKQYHSWENKTPTTTKLKRLYTPDLSQIAGALSKNPKGEERYKEVMGIRVPGCSGSREACFMVSSSSGFKQVRNPKRFIASHYETDFSKGAQLVQKAKDITSMVVMDHIMSQQDRFGNQHYYDHYFYQNVDGSYDKVKVKDYRNDAEAKQLVSLKDEAKKIPYEKVTTIKVLIMKDNDCGVIKSNKIKDHKMISKIEHMDYKLYKKVQAFKTMINSEEGGQYFKDFAKFTSSDLKKVRENASEVADLLKSNCKRKGSDGRAYLEFDLSFSSYFENREYNHEDYPCDI